MLVVELQARNKDLDLLYSSLEVLILLLVVGSSNLVKSVLEFLWGGEPVQAKRGVENHRIVFLGKISKH